VVKLLSSDTRNKVVQFFRLRIQMVKNGDPLVIKLYDIKALTATNNGTVHAPKLTEEEYCEKMKAIRHERSQFLKTWNSLFIIGLAALDIPVHYVQQRASKSALIVDGMGPFVKAMTDSNANLTEGWRADYMSENGTLRWSDCFEVRRVRHGGRMCVATR
jgi:hypothetical protein